MCPRACDRTITRKPDGDNWYPTAYTGYYISLEGDVYGPGRYGYGKILTPTPDRDGHLYITVTTEDGHIRKYVHVLLAETLIPNPHNYPFVRHLDDNPDNNHISNLAWDTSYDNVHDMIRNGTAYCLKCRTPGKVLDIMTGDIFSFESQREAANHCGVTYSAFTRILNRKRGQVNGYVICYENESFEDYDYKNTKNTYMKILATDLDTGEKIVFNNQKEAADELGIGSRMINRVLKGNRPHTHNYKFEYIPERSR